MTSVIGQIKKSILGYNAPGDNSPPETTPTENTTGDNPQAPTRGPDPNRPTTCGFDPNSNPNPNWYTGRGIIWKLALLTNQHSWP